MGESVVSKRKIRTTLRPDVELDVTEQEYTDLSRQGLIAGEDKPDGLAPVRKIGTHEPMSDTDKNEREAIGPDTNRSKP